MRKLVPLSSLVVFLAALGFILLAQSVSGAMDAPFGPHPDAPAHAVSSILVRDYLSNGIPENPLSYAQEFYSRYPKVAIGYWPPFFYGVAGVWLLAFGVSKFSFMLLMALIGALGAVMLWGTLRVRLGAALALFAVCAFLGVATISRSATSTMLELPLAVLSFAACLAFVRFLKNQNLPNSLLFALFASATILTKGNGFYLAFLPALVMVLTGRRRLLLGWQIWAGALVVAILTIPWFLIFLNVYTAHFAAQSVFEYAPIASGVFAIALYWVHGALLTALAILGLVLATASLLRKREGSAAGLSEFLVNSPDSRDFWATMAASPIAFFVFHIGTPSGIEGRYWYAVLLPICALAAAGLRYLTDFAGHWPRASIWMPRGVLVLSMVLLPRSLWSSLGADAIVRSQYGGLAAAWVAGQPQLVNSTVLVCCEGTMEGEFIAELLLRTPGRPPQLRILRASQLFPTPNAARRRRTGLVDRSPAIKGPLEELPIRAVILPPRPISIAASAFPKLLSMLQRRPDIWQPVKALPGRGEPGRSVPLLFIRRGNLK